MPKKLCRLCGKKTFEDGYGTRRKVEGVPDQICNPCAEESVHREVGRTVEYVEGMKLEHSDLGWQPLLDKAYRSQRRFDVWQRNFYSEPSVDKAGYLRLCDDDSTFIPRDAKRFLIDARLAQAEEIMARIGRVEIPIDTTDPPTIRVLQERQRRLDVTRTRIQRGIELIKENIRKLDTRGLLRGPAWWNVLADTTAAAVQLHFRVQNYEKGQDRVDAHLMEQQARQAAAAIGTEAQKAAEEHLLTIEPEEEGPPQLDATEDASEQTPKEGPEPEAQVDGGPQNLIVGEQPEEPPVLAEEPVAPPDAGQSTTEAPKKARKPAARKNGGDDGKGEKRAKSPRPRNGEQSAEQQIADQFETAADSEDHTAADRTVETGVLSTAAKADEEAPVDPDSPFAQLAVAENGDVVLRDDASQEGKES